MDSLADKIVTLDSFLPLRGQSEAVGGPPQELSPDEVEALALFERVLDRLQDATDEVRGAEVLITVQDRDVSRVMSLMAEELEARRPFASGGAEVQFGTGLRGGDKMRWILSLLDHVRHDKAHRLLRPTVAAAEAVVGDFSVAIAADWGTGRYGAPKTAESILGMAASKPFDLLMHLGDIYYSGTRGEVEDRFLERWPTRAGLRNRALNGNHEMYSGGFGYFKLILPQFGQESSYFALQNEHWLLVGLDTAYVDHDVDEEQVVWLDTILKQAENRKVVLFSHHQPFSWWDQPGLKLPKLPRSLRRILAGRLITAWYWGHEHKCIIYDRHELWGLHGRCLGNGGIPEPRSRDVRQAPVDAAHGGGAGCAWRRLPATDASPGCIVLDGRNDDMFDESDKELFGPHGFMTLAFDGPELTERVFLSTGVELYANTIG